MLIKELQDLVNSLDKEKSIAVSMHEECHILLRADDIQLIEQQNEYDGYIVNLEKYKYKRLKKLEDRGTEKKKVQKSTQQCTFYHSRSYTDFCPISC